MNQISLPILTCCEARQLLINMLVGVTKISYTNGMAQIGYVPIRLVAI